jgi:Zn-dependent M28 family amino/carboxypeptidase
MIKKIFLFFFLFGFSLYAEQVIYIPGTSLNKIDAEGLLTHTKILASDEYEGRGVGTKGEKLTINYIADNFKLLGLKAAGDAGTYFQKVPLTGITADPETINLVFSTIGDALNYKNDYVIWTTQERNVVDLIGKDVVFVGYGVTAPEYGWDDFKNVDVKDKILVVLINDPQIPDPEKPEMLDETMFEGKAMTYYGRWTYKFEEAARRGAAGALVIHETGPAGYGWNVVEASNTGELFTLGGETSDKLPFQGWITYETATKLFHSAKLDLEGLKKKALDKSFTPVNLGVKGSVHIDNSVKNIESNNVIGLFEGKDPVLKNEYVVYMAHWDHFGVGDPVNGDAIYNGANDNAIGVASLFELAEAFNNAGVGPSRSVIFLSVTAEEQGLLGSQYYTEHPTFPLEKTIGVVNIDGLNTYGRTKDITVVGYGQSSLDEYIEKAAKNMQGRIITIDPEPEKGFFYRSDHFNFAKKGVPALDPDQGTIFIGKPDDYGIKLREWYNENIYHSPFDEVRDDWDLSGAVEDLQLFFTVGYMMTETDTWPVWKESSEFRAIREASLKSSR